MTNGTVARTPTACLIAVVALVQAAFGLLRAVDSLQIASHLMGTRVPLHPVFGVMMLVRGALTASIALLYGLFAWGIFRGHPWARPVGLFAAALNLVLVLSLVIREQYSARGLVWCIVPVIVACYLLPRRRAAESVP